MNLSPQAWVALAATGAVIAVLAVCCLVPPLLESWGARRYLAETRRLEADERQRQLMPRLNADAAATAGPATVPAPLPAATQRRVDRVVARMRRPLDRLKARNERILRERLERRG